MFERDTTAAGKKEPWLSKKQPAYNNKTARATMCTPRQVESNF
jgi:hypothetical protein